MIKLIKYLIVLGIILVILISMGMKDYMYLVLISIFITPFILVILSALDRRNKGSDSPERRTKIAFTGSLSLNILLYAGSLFFTFIFYMLGGLEKNLLLFPLAFAVLLSSSYSDKRIYRNIFFILLGMGFAWIATVFAGWTFNHRDSSISDLSLKITLALIPALLALACFMSLNSNKNIKIYRRVLFTAIFLGIGLVGFLILKELMNY